MHLVVEKAERLSPEALSIEMVERKGQGHPDTICDCLAEAFSRGLCKFYLEHFGTVLHHNVDKCVLIGGSSSPCFGGGRVTEPIQVLLVGRAVQAARGVRVPIEDIARESTFGWVRSAFRFLKPGKHLLVTPAVRRGSVDLSSFFSSKVPLANDTSFGVGYWPLNNLERLVLSTENLLNGSEIRKAIPAVGEDIKVMGVRQEKEITLTVAVAVVSRLVKSPEEYQGIMRKILKRLRENAAGFKGFRSRISVNNADDPKKGIFYLTVTGTSAECGDDGQVGRGNRMNGLITPYRPMTLEAPAGKNPVSHTGKLYSVAAQRICRELVETWDVKNASCALVSKIGSPVSAPQAVHLNVESALSRRAVADRARRVVQKHLRDVPNLWKEFIEGKVGYV